MIKLTGSPTVRTRKNRKDKNVERELFGKRKVSGKSGRGQKRAIRGKLDCSMLHTCAGVSQ